MTGFPSIAIAIALAGCGKREDRHDEQAAPSKLSLDVAIGGTTAHWGDAAFAGVARMAGTASDGEARDVWNLRDLARANVGPTARITALHATDGTTATIDAAAWADPSRVPILHTTKRGTLKFRYAKPDGTWDDTVLKDVTSIDVQR